MKRVCCLEKPVPSPAPGELLVTHAAVHECRMFHSFGSFDAARELGAGTMLVTCNPARRRDSNSWDIEIDMLTGPELVTGSTRLKAGTATKLVVNLLSTGAMIRLGRADQLMQSGNAMVDLRISNQKLRDRGARLVSAALGIQYDEALMRLEAAEWNVRACVEQGR